MKKIKNLFILLCVFFCFSLLSCQKQICTITFENENGDFIKSVEVYSGSKVDKPDLVEEYEGYSFDNWYLGDKEYSFDSKVVKDITLVAKYTPNQYTLSFGDLAAPIEVLYGKPVGQIPNVPNVEGKEYGIWTLDGVILTSTTVYNFTEDKVAVANYSDEMFTVSFIADEETKQAVTYGSKAIEPKTPEKTGYEFTGWYLNDAKFDFNTIVKENITLQARWEPKTDTAYSVEVFAEVGDEYLNVSSNYADVINGLVGTTEEVIDITETAKQFIPANYILNIEKSTLKGTVAGDGSLVLSVYCDVVRYTVNFDVEEVLDQIVKVGSTANKPVKPEKEGYIFHSWLLGENEYDFSSEVTSDINLTASWLEVKDHVVTFESLHETEIKPQSLTNGDKVSAPTELEKVGYTFEGWYYGNEEWDFNTSLTAVHDKSINLVAKWVANQYELSFDEDGNDAIVVTYDQPIGELPALSKLNDSTAGNWYIDGQLIDSNTIWKFVSDKQANSMYFVDMLSKTIDLSTKGEIDLNTQLINALGLSAGSIDKITENGVEVPINYLSKIEANATDEASRTRTLVVIVGDIEYKLNVFFATKVIYTYEELTKIQEYGGVKTSKFPADYTYTMYSYSGYFILGNDIDASPSMTKTYKVGSMARYDSQTWDTEMEGFRGVFDGRGHTINNLHTGASGLLGDVLEGAIIRNLAITNAQIKDNTSGVLCFIFSRATIENVYIDFTVGTNVKSGGIFGRMNKVGTIRNVVVKYTNSRQHDPNNSYTVGVLSSWQVNTKYIPLPNFENVSFIYGNGTDVSNMQAIGNSTFISAGIKEYVVQNDGSMLAIKSKAAGTNEFTSYTTGSLLGNEFVNYPDTYWDLSGTYPVFK